MQYPIQRCSAGKHNNASHTTKAKFFVFFFSVDIDIVKFTHMKYRFIYLKVDNESIN